MIHSKKDSTHLSFFVIISALNEDTAAINHVLKHYSPYLTKLATREVFDADGSIRRVYDEDIKRELEIKLITAIFKFKVRPNLK